MLSERTDFIEDGWYERQRPGYNDETLFTIHIKRICRTCVGWLGLHRGWQYCSGSRFMHTETGNCFNWKEKDNG